ILQTRLSKLVSVAEDAGMDAAIQVAADRRNKYFVRIIAPESRTVLMSPAGARQKFDLPAFQQRPLETRLPSFPSRTDSDALRVSRSRVRVFTQRLCIPGRRGRGGPQEQGRLSQEGSRSLSQDDDGGNDADLAHRLGRRVILCVSRNSAGPKSYPNHAVDH